MAVADRILEAERGADSSRHTTLDAFRLHFQSLVDEKVCYELVGKLPDWRKDGPELPPEVLVYSGLDWMEGFKEALRRNIQGYNIFFTPKDAMGCLDFEWIGLSALTDRTGDNAGIIIEHALEMNVEEFSGKAKVLDAGDRIWFLIRLPNRTAREMYEPTRLRKSIRLYCTNLGLKWNRIARNVITFHIDNVDFFPGMNMPVAGLFNHNLKPSCRICWLEHVGNEPQADLLTRILATKDPIRQMMKQYYDLDFVDVEGHLPLLNFNPDFTAESLDRLLMTDAIARKILVEDLLCGPDASALEIMAGKMLLLWSFFRAGPNVTGPCLTRMGRLAATGARHDLGPAELVRMSHAADAIVRSARSTGTDDSAGTLWNNRRKFSAEAQIGNLVALDSRSAENELSKRYGPVSYLTRNGWYAFRLGEMPGEIVQIQDKIGRMRTYVPVPCSFRVAANESLDGSGALLVPRSKADGFLEEAGRIGAKGVLVVAYVWYFGLKYRMFGMPESGLEDGPDRVGSVGRYAQDHHPEIMKLRRSHMLDRNRKGGQPEILHSQPKQHGAVGRFIVAAKKP